MGVTSCLPQANDEGEEIATAPVPISGKNVAYTSIFEQRPMASPGEVQAEMKQGVPFYFTNRAKVPRATIATSATKRPNPVYLLRYDPSASTMTLSNILQFREISERPNPAFATTGEIVTALGNFELRKVNAEVCLTAPGAEGVCVASLTGRYFPREYPGTNHVVPDFVTSSVRDAIKRINHVLAGFAKPLDGYPLCPKPGIVVDAYHYRELSEVIFHTGSLLRFIVSKALYEELDAALDSAVAQITGYRAGLSSSYFTCYNEPDLHTPYLIVRALAEYRLMAGNPLAHNGPENEIGLGRDPVRAIWALLGGNSPEAPVCRGRNCVEQERSQEFTTTSARHLNIAVAAEDSGIPALRSSLAQDALPILLNNQALDSTRCFSENQEFTIAYGGWIQRGEPAICTQNIKAQKIVMDALLDLNRHLSSGTACSTSQWDTTCTTLKAKFLGSVAWVHNLQRSDGVIEDLTPERATVSATPWATSYGVNISLKSLKGLAELPHSIQTNFDGTQTPMLDIENGLVKGARALDTGTAGNRGIIAAELMKYYLSRLDVLID